MKITKIYSVNENYYGGLYVMTLNGKFYWLIETHDIDFDNIDDWTEITSTLYESIIDFENN